MLSNNNLRTFITSKMLIFGLHFFVISYICYILLYLIYVLSCYIFVKFLMNFYEVLETVEWTFSQQCFKSLFFSKVFKSLFFFKKNGFADFLFSMFHVYFSNLLLSYFIFVCLKYEKIKFLKILSKTSITPV